MTRTADGRPGHARNVIKALRIGAAASMIVGASLPISLTTAMAASATAGRHATVLTSHKGSMGWQLVVKLNGQALSLYIAWGDTHRKSRCYGSCAKTWIPLLDRGRIIVANRSCHSDACQINQNRLGTIKRKDGSLQVTYYGSPLYRYRMDTRTGQVRGQNKHEHGAAALPRGLYCDWCSTY